MGILDHRKTWRFQVSGSPQDCRTAFTKAFSRSGGGGNLLIRAKWDVSQSDDGAAAIYRGRAGMGKGAAIMSKRSGSEEDAAINSKVSFKIERVADGVVTCAMWLSAAGNLLGVFTADARFFRPYMAAVERQLRQIDPQLSVTKS
ncbi:MAG: hypothetical protein JO345_30280 [Streptosporangiaceae bacterium]|nr:hypothetical protein [Streptosporangiaceae bacterium]